MSKQSSWAS